ncbi:M14 family zinc carboxypeptidase [Tamlana crocina]|uniref:Peptidase M14 n=1 Tax=Tamlana crocina TaxID=393006 RepID=A0ABX1DDU2_9FLAO|nr:M14 family zinc carboxypeptidase [Tamlana crocina]NJX15183.1 peptidase M14 [Tamlana crocina]
MKIEALKSLFKKHKELALSHRYITNKHIEPLLEKFDNSVWRETIGQSVLGKPIYGLKIGTGKKRVLMWSQMHGNESTTTKALFDLLNTLLANSSGVNDILESCTLYVIPILNPDGAEAYTRVNANEIDLNRDAQNLSQPESKVLRVVFNSFKPHFCYNLHGQRTIFSAGKRNKSAIVSFLSPAQDEGCTVTENRKVSMEIIAEMYRVLQELIPSHVGVYDDAFNLNCVGDTFQSENVPTILFEAGHYPGDYGREKTRELIYISYLSSLLYISKNEVTGAYYKPYFDIPENEKYFYDIIIRNAQFGTEKQDVAIQFQERLMGGRIQFIPKVVEIGDLNNFFGHKEIEVQGNEVKTVTGELLKIDSENVFVMIKNKKTSLISE